MAGPWVLGIESSCDDTAAAVVDPDGRIQGDVISGQDALHADYGGVVPELASREHLAHVRQVVEQAMAQAGVPLSKLDGIAVTVGPGLIGSLLVGVSFARALGFASSKPVIGVNHLEGHMFAPFVGSPEPEFPFVALVVSGGHTSLYVVEALGRYRVLGATRDDAAGEAFDKVAKLLGLGYPGGAHVDRLARDGNPGAVAFPRAMLAKGGYDFSFSGLKTAVRYHLERAGATVAHADVAASFQEAVVDVLVAKTLKAANEYRVARILVSGGVAANTVLRQRFEGACRRAGYRLAVPAARFCTDNGAMIGWVGWQRIKHGLGSTGLCVRPRLAL